MSAFLGPIHFWLYNKIQFQESLIDELIRYASSQGWSDSDLADKYGSKDRRKLDEVLSTNRTSTAGSSRVSTMPKAVMPPWYSTSPATRKTA